MIAAGAARTRRLRRAKIAGTCMCRPIDSVMRAKPETLVVIASSRIATAVSPTPSRRASANHHGPPIACTSPRIGAFTQVVESPLEYPAGAEGSRCAGKADTAAVATAA